MSDVTNMTDAEKAAKWDSLMALTGGRVEELDNAMVSVAAAVENMQSLLRRGADALERVRSDNSAIRTKLAEVERERDAAARELASLPITIRVAGHGPVMARVTTFDNARMLFAGLQATSENGGNFGWVIEDTRPPIIPAIASQPAEKEECR